MSNNEFVTHNMWKIIMLQVHGITPLRIDTGKIEGSKSNRTVLKYAFPEEAQEIADAWDRGDDSETMHIVRETLNVIEMFKENLRRRLN